jgi:hypothetical protein
VEQSFVPSLSSLKRLLKSLEKSTICPTSSGSKSICRCHGPWAMGLAGSSPTAVLSGTTLQKNANGGASFVYDPQYEQQQKESQLQKGQLMAQKPAPTMRSPVKAQEPTGPMFPVKADVKVASARVQGHGAMPESQEQQLHHKFETDVAAKAQGLLKANKDHLNTEQAQYAQDKNPKSDRWSKLWQAEGKRRAYEIQEHQMVDERMRVVEESNGLSTALDPLYDTPADQVRKKQRAAYLESRQAFLNSQIEYTRQMQVSLSYSYPALTAIKGETGANPGDIQRVQARLPQAFNEIRGDIDRIGQWLADDPSKAWLFDSVVVSQLKDKSLSAQQRGQLIAEVERQRQSAAGGLMLGSVLSGGLFAASFVPGLQDFAIPLRMAGLGIGGGVAASEIPDLMLLDLAAQSGRGGAGALTNQSPEQARFNLVMGYANVGLAGLDVGLEVGAVQKLAGLTGKLASAGVQVSREKWSQVMSWVKQGPEGVEKAKAFFASVKGVSKEKAAEAIQLIKNGFSPEVETVGVPGQSAVKTAEENVKDAKALQSRGNAGGTATGRHVLEDYANASKVKSFIGTKVDPNHLPEGYLYGKIPTGKDALGRDIYREVVYMPTPGKTTVPLRVENGRIEMGLKGEYRIVEKAVYDKNVVTDPTKPGKLLGGDSQIHHLFADNMLRNTPFGQRALRLGAVNPDGSINLIELASSKSNLVEARKAYPNVPFSDFVHNTQHTKFDELMQTVVDDVIKEVREAKGFSGDNEKFILQMTKEEIQAVWNKSLARMRRGLMNQDKQLYPKIKTRPNSGSLAQGESPDHSEVA